MYMKIYITEYILIFLSCSISKYIFNVFIHIEVEDNIRFCVITLHPFSIIHLKHLISYRVSYFRFTESDTIDASLSISSTFFRPFLAPDIRSFYIRERFIETISDSFSFLLFACLPCESREYA